jgi:hypothetical protein
VAAHFAIDTDAMLEALGQAARRHPIEVQPFVGVRAYGFARFTPWEAGHEFRGQDS